MINTGVEPFFITGCSIMHLTVKKDMIINMDRKKANMYICNIHVLIYTVDIGL